MITYTQETRIVARLRGRFCKASTPGAILTYVVYLRSPETGEIVQGRALTDAESVTHMMATMSHRIQSRKRSAVLHERHLVMGGKPYRNLTPAQERHSQRAAAWGFTATTEATHGN